MEKQNENKEVYVKHKYSNDFYDIIERFPKKYNLLLIGGLLTLLLAGFLFAWFTKSNDIVKAEVKIVSNSYTADLAPKLTGNIKILNVHQKDEIQEGQYIAIINNTTNEKQVEALNEKLRNFDIDSIYQAKYLYEFINGDFGEIQNVIFEFIYSYYKYTILRDSKKYDIEISSLNKQIALQDDLLKNETDLYNNFRLKSDISSNLLKKDSILFLSSELTEDVYLENIKNYYQDINNQTSKRIDIIRSKLNKEILTLKKEKLFIEKQDIEGQLKLELISNFNKVIIAIREWENKYVIKAPFTGTLEFFKFIDDGSFVQSSEPLFSVIPDNQFIKGHALLPNIGSGKVKLGQEVIIKLTSYPYQEYGYLEGTVKSISLLPKDNMYLISLDMPKGLISNTGIEFNFSKEMTGVGEIITNKRRLINRLYEKITHLIEPETNNLEKQKKRE